MGRHQGVQSRLREALRTSLPTAVAEGRLPIAGEIARAHVPFLEAVIEETLRYTHIAPVVQREAVVDTTIFGHPVPRARTSLCQQHRRLSATGSHGRRGQAVRELAPRQKLGGRLGPGRHGRVHS